MTSRARLAALGAALTILTAACGSNGSPPPSVASAAPTGSGQPAILPIQVSSFFRVGDNRVVFSLVDPTGQKAVASPDRSLTIGYRGPAGQTIAPATQSFIWAVEGVKGVYVGHATCPA